MHLFKALWDGWDHHRRGWRFALWGNVTWRGWREKACKGDEKDQPVRKESKSLWHLEVKWIKQSKEEGMPVFNAAPWLDKMRAKDWPLGLAVWRLLVIVATAFERSVGKKEEELETEYRLFFCKVCSNWTKEMGLGVSSWHEKWNEGFFF